MVFLKSLYLVLSISISFFLMMMMNIVLAGPTGLTLKLIHRDSLESPLYPGRNLTKLERMERSFQRMKARHQQMTAASMNSSVRNNNNNNNSTSPDALHPPVSFTRHEFEYIVELGIGTFPKPSPPHTEVIHDYNTYKFQVDTGSDLLWLQCEECTDCFQQDDPLFPWKKSITYRPLLCGKDPCPYGLEYADGSTTAGVYAVETLVVDADNDDHIDVVEGFVFGCGFKQLNFAFGDNDKGENPIAGILGLGGGEESFVRQLGNRGQLKFEYCLRLWTDETSPSGTFLRFGSDTKLGGGGQVIQTTPLIFVRGSTAYYAEMFDISVGGTKIGYHEGEFDTDQDGNGGCIFDTGTPWTTLSTKVYDPLKAQLIQYFTDLDIHTHDPGTEWKKYELCFKRPNVFSNFPKITFHFVVPNDKTKSADLEIDTEAAFDLDTDGDFFCFNILRNDRVRKSVILGGIQQANQRILYDLENNQISWSKEKCVADS